MQRGIAILVLLSVTFCVTGPADTLAGPVTALEEAGLVGPVYIIVERLYSIEPGDESVSEDLLIDKTMKTFDRNGNQTELIRYGANDFVAKRTTFEYDQDGYVRKMEIMSPDGNVTSRGVGEYDAKRNLSTITVYDADGVFDHSSDIVYDDQGFGVETTIFTRDSQLFERIVYQYDDAGHQVGEDAYDKSGLVDMTVREFAANGEVSRDESYNPDGTPWFCFESTHELLFDDVGNWSRRETTDIDCLEGRDRTEMMAVTYRDITYYD